ncbi:MAG: N-acetyltransferase family protein [Phycisphaerales bacterium]
MPAFDVVVRAATPADAGLILEFIRELAEYERLVHEVVATEAAIRSTLFGDAPAAEVLMCEHRGEPAGFALHFPTYSTFLGRSGIHLEDLFVRPAHRGAGCGRMLLSALARVAIERGAGRLEWAVLDWNTSAIGFYRSIGAASMDGWTTNRLTGAALESLAAQ